MAAWLSNPGLIALADRISFWFLAPASAGSLPLVFSCVCLVLSLLVCSSYCAGIGAGIAIGAFIDLGAVRAVVIRLALAGAHFAPPIAGLGRLAGYQLGPAGVHERRA